MDTSILIFGAGELQISIIKKAKNFGFKTIVLDPNSNAVGKKYCDIFFRVDGDDFEKTLEIAKYYNVKGVVTAATDHPILMMCRIAAELKLPFPSLHSCEKLLNKGKFKQFLKENDIKHAKGSVYKVSDLIDKNQFEYPLIFKPIKNSGSRGVLKCENLEDFEETFSECAKFCKEDEIIIEEFLDGDEISIEAFVVNKIVEIIQITDKIITKPPYNVELGHIQPSVYINRRFEIQNVLQKIVDRLNLNNCILHPEIKICNNELIIIEIGPRLGGDNITSMLVPLSTGIDIEAVQLDIALGNEIHLELKNSNSSISYLNFSMNSIVKDIIVLEDLQSIFPDVIDFKTTLVVDEVIKPITNSLNRYGYFVIQNEDRLQLFQRSKLIMEYLSNIILK